MGIFKVKLRKEVRKIVDTKNKQNPAGIENPRTWNEVQRAINDAIKEHGYLNASEGGFSGPSLVSMIYNKLLGKGYLAERFLKPPKS